MILARAARRALVFGIAGSILLAAQQTSETAATLAQKDAEAIVKRVEADYVDAYDKKDAKAVAALFTENATEMSEFGGVTQGREKIEKSLTPGFSTPMKWKTENTPKGTLVVSNDVIVTQGTSRRTREGSSEKPDNTFYTKVLVREGDQWRIAAIQYAVAPISRYVGPPRPGKTQPARTPRAATTPKN